MSESVELTKGEKFEDLSWSQQVVVCILGPIFFGIGGATVFMIGFGMTALIANSFIFTIKTIGKSYEICTGFAGRIYNSYKQYTKFIYKKYHNTDKSE